MANVVGESGFNGRGTWSPASSSPMSTLKGIEKGSEFVAGGSKECRVRL